MNQNTKRSILRWIHIVFSIPIIGYVYSPFDKIPEYAGPTRFVFLPVLVVTGLWMWKGQAVRQMVWRGEDRVRNWERGVRSGDGDVRFKI